MHIPNATRLIAAATLIAAAVAGCNDGGSTVPTPPPPTPQTTQFSAFANTVFAAGANTTPINFDGVNFVFDVDNDPMAFDGLLM